MDMKNSLDGYLIIGIILFFGDQFVILKIKLNIGFIKNWLNSNVHYYNNLSLYFREAERAIREINGVPPYNLSVEFRESDELKAQRRKNDVYEDQRTMAVGPNVWSAPVKR